jgi:hypothetical protein
MWWLSGLALAHIPVIVNSGPDQDWCGAYASAMQGDIVLLEPGDYTGPCTLVGKPPDPEYPTELSVLAARDTNDRPRFHSDGSSPAILTITGEQAQVAWLAFPDVPAGTTAIALADTRASWLLDLDFAGVAGTAVAATGANVGLRLSELVVGGAGGTGLDVTGTELIFEDVLLGGLSVGLRAVGDGTVSEVVSDGGIGLDLDGPLEVEQSAIRGDVIVRGPAVLESSIVVGTVDVRGGGAKLYGNTLYSPQGTPLLATGWTEGSVLQNNAIGGALPDLTGATGNVVCADPAACWRDAPGNDFYPRAAGPLCAGGVAPDTGRLFSDWCGYARQTPMTPGALESLGAPIPPIRFDVAKTFDSCAAVAEFDTGCAPPPDTDLPGDTSSPATDGGSAGGADGGCGCAAAERGPAGLAPWLAFGWLIRARSRNVRLN